MVISRDPSSGFLHYEKQRLENILAWFKHAGCFLYFVVSIRSRYVEKEKFHLEGTSKLYLDGDVTLRYPF
jgi:hypothetical protein